MTACAQSQDKNKQDAPKEDVLKEDVLKEDALKEERPKEDNIILPGVLDLPRQIETAQVDGCTKPHKGHRLDGGFLLIACEKLLPPHPIDKHDSVADHYADDLIKAGWTFDVEDPEGEQEADEIKFVRNDASGCRIELSMMVWKDRSMNERRRADMTRDDYRQIVFITEFEGEGRCDHHYDTVKALTDYR